jgi:hypothetical protein
MLKIGQTTTVGASMYGGPGDPTSGHTGYQGDHLDGTDTFAELGTGGAIGNALGGLPYGTPLLIEKDGKSLVVYKRDVGLGGGPVSGLHRSVDLWYEDAQKIGLNGLGVLRITRLDPRTVPPAKSAKAQAASRGSSNVTRAPADTAPQSQAAAGVFGSDTGPQSLYALVFLVSLAGGAALFAIGLNRAMGGAPMELAKTGAKATAAGRAAKAVT